MAKTLATQRSLKELRKRGWQCAIVERWQMRPQAAYGVRIDVWGFGDILACKSYARTDNPTNRTEGQIALIQTFPLSTWKDHAEKMQEPKIKEAIENWKAAGGLVFMHGWALKPKDGVRGAKKTWQLREEAI
jgi:hypothetical protein